MDLELILTELRPFKLSHFRKFLHCKVKSFYSFQWLVLKLCRLIVDMLKICIRIFDGARINFDRITAFQT